MTSLLKYVENTLKRKGKNEKGAPMDSREVI